MKPSYIVQDPPFEKRLKKYTEGLTATERSRFKRRFEIFVQDIFDARLKTHKLKGRLESYYAFSLSYSDRLVFRLLEDGGVYLIEIGSHDVCY
jgi:mRNA-degrading endonuclease YafQ of YafQ-DinJ toxin-antitoxin module